MKNTNNTISIEKGSGSEKVQGTIRAYIIREVGPYSGNYPKEFLRLMNLTNKYVNDIHQKKLELPLRVLPFPFNLEEPDFKTGIRDYLLEKGFEEDTVKFESELKRLSDLTANFLNEVHYEKIYD